MPKQAIDHQLDVVGLGFRMKRPEREALAAKINGKPLRGITLTREPGNKYDANAIKVQIPGGNEKHYGYIRLSAAEVLAPKLDDGTVEVESASLLTLHAAQDYKEGVLNVRLIKHG